ncbi:MAG TPA: DUF3617 family protein [Thermoanaerobaculia bacterium]|jgi:hypothetical protein|nr:DUF3617 family protein [Thermoanaerobaculia bacterium]
MSQPVRTLKLLVCVLAVAGIALAAGRTAAAENGAAADHPNLKPGSWEITTAMEMEGMPPRPGFTNTICIKPDQIKDSHAFAETQQGQRGGKCKVSDLKFEGDKLSYSFACEHGSGTTELAFGGTTYEGTIKITASGRGNSAPMTIIQHVKAKRTGDC